MKKFNNKLASWIKTIQRNKPVKHEMKHEDGTTVADNQHSETAVVCVPAEVVDENKVPLLTSEMTLFSLLQQNVHEHPVKSVEDDYHIALTVDECRVCNLKQGGPGVMERYKCANEEILPVEFIASVDENFSNLVPVRERKEIQKAVLEDIKFLLPSYYDFCVIASEDDYSRANEFKLLISNAFSLRGCMLYDGFLRLGSDLFECYEAMIEHSTKVFFFITDSFNADNFYRRLQNGTVFNSLMARAKKEREKCVPVFPNGSCRVPLALCGIAGIIPRNHDILHQSLSTTYTIANREQLALKNQYNNKLRAVRYVEMFQKKIMDRKQEQDALQDRIADCRRSDNMVQLYDSPVVDQKMCGPYNSDAVEEGKIQLSACQLKIAGSSIQSELESTASFVKQTDSVLRNCVDHNIKAVLQPNLGDTPNESLGTCPENRKHEPATKTDGDSSFIIELLEEIKKVFPGESDGNTYDITGNNTQIGPKITLNIYNQQNSCFMGSSNAHCSDNEEDEDDSSIDHSDSADSDVDLNESVKLPSRESAVETDQGSSCSECSDTCGSEMSKVRS